MKLSVIIVSYNTQELTLQTLESVVADLNRSPNLKSEAEIVVIDNNSEDGSPTALKKFKENQQIPVQLILNDENTGFAIANNQGIEKSDGDVVLLLNSDTIVQPQALEKLVEALDNSPKNTSSSVLSMKTDALDNLGIVAAALLNPDNTHQPQGGHLPTLTTLFVQMTMIDDLPLIGHLLPSVQHTGKNDRIADVVTNSKAKKELIPVEWVGGTAMALDRQLLNEIGGLDQNIFMYGEDIELCLRAQHHHWDVAIHPGAQVIHLKSQSSSSKNAIHGELKGYLYLWAKHKPQWQMPLLKSLIALGILLRLILFGTITKNKKKFNIYKEAYKIIK